MNWFKIILIALGVIVLGTAIFFITKPNMLFGPCKVWKSVYSGEYKATSEEDAKNLIKTMFEEKKLVNFEEKNVINTSTAYAKTLFLFDTVDYYEVNYFFCGSLEEAKKFDPDETTGAYPLGAFKSFELEEKECSEWPAVITFHVKKDDIWIRFSNPC